MQHNLRLYNTLSKQKELFEPLNPPFVGMYVCGPTVYNYVHLGNVRTFLSFDVLYRYLLHLGYTVRYVRNITDVGHLENDADEGEDKIAKKARIERLEPMEIVQRYSNDFHDVLRQLNFLPPNIEPSATGHISEQIESIKILIDKGLAYESGGSVYFDVLQYNKHHHYGQLSGRIIEDLLNETRELDGQSEKRNPLDFALWKNASAEHIMRWPSPWGIGFPGWHIECTSMSTKYLGDQFDIHGGGMDLKFPHHECEIAQAVGVNGVSPVKYWLHTNMLTVNGEKMAKSKDNSFLPAELFTGQHPLLSQAYSQMTVRFFMLQAHYRSTLDFTNEALQSAQKGYKRLMNGLRFLKSLSYQADATVAIDEKNQKEVNTMCDACGQAMDDDINTAVVIANLFNLLRKINSIQTGQLKTASLGEETFHRLKSTFITFTEDILGLQEEKTTDPTGLIDSLLDVYQDAKTAKEYDKVDRIRTYFKAQGLVIKDMKTGVDWAYYEE
ncbi:MAG: cysteine--tRNA ligase [Bacteroidota bacterium]